MLASRFELLRRVDVKDLLAAVVELLEWAAMPQARRQRRRSPVARSLGALENFLAIKDWSLTEACPMREFSTRTCLFPDEVEASVGKTDLVGGFLFSQISDTYLIIFKVFQCDLFCFQDL